MGKVIVLIGRLCSGKTTYVRRLMEEEHAIPLSSDELMQTIFPEPLGDQFDKYCRRGMQYLYQLAGQLARSGAVVVLDMGMWTRENRREVREALEGVELDWRWLRVDDDEWKRRIEERNRRIREGRGQLHEYFVDEGLLNKANAMFQPPEEDESLNITMVHT